MTKLKTVTRTQGNNRALVEGRVRPAGFELDFAEVPVLTDGFRRMVRDLEFDVCEMALTTYMCARAHGKAFTALPIFLVRAFHHGALLVNSSVRVPKDLEGRRVGVNRGYTVTTGLWARSVLALEHGVDLDRITWVLSGDEHVAEYHPPPNVVPMGPGQTMAERVLQDDLAGAIGADIASPEVRPVISDAVNAGYEALRQRGHYPINHLVVVRDDVLEQHPDAARALFDAFTESKRLYVEELRAGTLTKITDTDRLHKRVMDTTGRDPLPYGIEPNRAALREAIDAAVSQHILAEAPDVDALFHPSVRNVQG